MGLLQGRIELGGKVKLNAGRKKAESMRSHVALPETDSRNGTLSGKSQTYGNRRINGGGLVWDIRVSQKYA